MSKVRSPGPGQTEGKETPMLREDRESIENIGSITIQLVQETTINAGGQSSMLASTNLIGTTG